MPLTQYIDTALWIPPWYVNSYYTCPGTTVTNAYTIGIMTAIPMLVPRATTIDRIGLLVTTAGDTAAKIRFGIYSDNGSSQPGSLLVDHGLTTAITVAAYKEVTIGSPTSLTGSTLYWLAAASENTAQDGTAYSSAVTMRAASQVSPYVGVVNPAVAQTTTGAGYMHNASVTAGLPGTFAISSGTPSPSFRVWVRCAS